MTSSLAAAWAVEVGIISVRDLTKEHRPPLPSELLASLVVFGALGIVGLAAPKAAGAAGWGLVLATLLAGTERGAKVDVLHTTGEFLSGRSPAAKASTARAAQPTTVN